MFDVRTTRRFLLPVAVGYALVAALVAPFTTGAEVAVAVPVVAMIAAAVTRIPVVTGRRPHRAGIGHHPAARRTVVVWAVVLGAITYWQLMVFTSSPRETYPTFSSMLNIAMGSYPVRAGTWLAWLGLGWYLVRRWPRRRPSPSSGASP